MPSLVSIVIPSYNQGQFLEETIKSVVNQDYPRTEYIVIDGGSTDGSVDIIRRYDTQLAYWISEPDAGQADAINKGWLRCSGEILAWLNSDDTYRSGAIRRIVEVFDHYPEADVVTADCTVVDESGNFVRALRSGEFRPEILLTGNSLPQQGVFCRREALESVGWLDSSLNNVFDWALWLKLWLHGFKFRHLPFDVANFRIWGNSKTGMGSNGASLSGGIPFARERFEVLNKLCQSDLEEIEPDQKEALYIGLASVILELALLYQLEGDNRCAAEFIAAYNREPVLQDLAPYPEIFAQHLAYAEGNLDGNIDAFLALLANQVERFSDRDNWKRILRSESLIVQGWYLSQMEDKWGAAKKFGEAIYANPRLIRKRNVLSSVIRHIF